MFIRRLLCILLSMGILLPQILNASPLTPDSGQEDSLLAMEKRLKRRRNMLENHQMWGLAAWTFWLASAIEGEAVAKTLERRGEKEINFLFLSNPTQYRDLYLLYQLSSPEYEPRRSSATHVALAGATWLTYSIAAYYSLTAPDRLQEARHRGFDSIFLHKSMAFIHFAAMLALPALAELPEEEGPRGVQKMRNVGWAGFGALTISIATFYF